MDDEHVVELREAIRDAGTEIMLHLSPDSTDRDQLRLALIGNGHLIDNIMASGDVFTTPTAHGMRIARTIEGIIDGLESVWAAKPADAVSGTLCCGRTDPLDPCGNESPEAHTQARDRSDAEAAGLNMDALDADQPRNADELLARKRK